ncbi:ATP-dependent DNA helicase PIF1-like protein [Tanacetum coccineum]
MAAHDMNWKLESLHYGVLLSFLKFSFQTQTQHFATRTLTAALRSKGHIVLNVASSGIAALLLDGGRISHSRFVIPINIMEDSLCTITADSDLADLIHETKNYYKGNSLIILAATILDLHTYIPRIELSFAPTHQEVDKVKDPGKENDMSQIA